MPRCGYRSSARTTAVVPPPRTGSQGGVLSLACLAAGGLTTAGVLGSLELGALAAAGALLALAHASRARQTRRAHASVLRFLGGRSAVRTEAGWASRDGSRRVRVATDGALTFEQVRSDGTVRAYRVPAVEGAVRGPARSATFTDCGVYVLHGRALAPSCFVGLPPSLGGEAVHVPAAHVHLERNADGYRLLRVDARGRPVGETVHRTRAHAERQLRREYGSHLGARRATPMRPAAEGWEPPKASLHGRTL